MVNALNEYNALGTFMYLRRYEVHIYLGRYIFAFAYRNGVEWGGYTGVY